MGDTLKAILYLVVLALIGYNIYTGATVQTVGIPGVFEVSFNTPSAPKKAEEPKEPEEPPQESGSKLANAYLMDKLSNRRIIMTHLGGNAYRVEEPSSPWPWEGTGTLDGGRFFAEARATTSQATFTLEGVLRGDGTIVIDYKFITGSDGSSAGGRVDHHIWYPE